ncbi:hypothetical protein [Glaciimonas immobilis]|uniref:Uncharacterized protein n=1 Tax=Glaciimonas immobilis TaxID=728004 RepID=A0A840RT48_9BURK|nr:hypothetical protein [Glaciimonas immobilis]KAF3996628.1 hypothetical protein HAV38_18535 [Glaciimonas immobilis]MBB5200995.1 hypothetical protein [Glaciimonas immobilis]
MPNVSLSPPRLQIIQHLPIPSNAVTAVVSMVDARTVDRQKNVRVVCHELATDVSIDLFILIGGAA